MKSETEIRAKRHQFNAVLEMYVNDEINLQEMCQAVGWKLNAQDDEDSIADRLTLAAATLDWVLK